MRRKNWRSTHHRPVSDDSDARLGGSVINLDHVVAASPAWATGGDLELLTVTLELLLAAPLSTVSLTTYAPVASSTKLGVTLETSFSVLWLPGGIELNSHR